MSRNPNREPSRGGPSRRAQRRNVHDARSGSKRSRAEHKLDKRPPGRSQEPKWRNRP